MPYKESSLDLPDYGLYDPNYSGRPIIHRVLLIILVGLTLLYSYYIILSLGRLFEVSLINGILNLITLIVEGLTGYYSLILFWHLINSFKPVSGTPAPLISKEDVQTGDVPKVSILIPCYKEPLSVVSQTIDAANNAKYPKDKLEISLIEDGRQDDSIEKYCNSSGVNYLTRENRKGFKAGAINYALPKLNGKYVLFIDSDHVIEPNIILNCMNAWRENTIAVQTRIDFVNMLTYLTTVAAFLQIQFFSLFQRGRRSSGSAIFAGGGALFDRELLLEEGGMDELTIADDTDTSFILRSRGHRIEYIDTIGAWALVPWDPLHLIRQVWRWLTGITRSFRSRGVRILKGKSSPYAKADHFSTAAFPTLAVLGWLMGFVFLIMVVVNAPFVRAAPISVFGNALVPGIVGSLPIVAGVLSLVLDDERVLYRRKSLFEKISSVVGFYMLLLAAQPLLLGAIFKGLFDFEVVFNRTPKEKKSSDNNLSFIKFRYLVQTIVIFVVGIVFVWAALSIQTFGDPRQIALFVNAYAAIIPLIIALLWYWKLEEYLDQVGDLSAIEFLESLQIPSPTSQSF